MADRPQATVNHELVIWAQTVLIGTHTPSDDETVRAYRILTRAYPRSYRAHLARALVSWSWGDGFGAAPEYRLALLEEAAAAAREVPESEPRRAELIVDVLHWYQIRLYEMGRRTDGLAVREEMAAVTRQALAAGARCKTEGLRTWAHGLAEEGRHGEAAAVLAELLDKTPATDRFGNNIWERFSLTTELDAAGRPDDAVGALGTIVAHYRAGLATDPWSLSIFCLTLIWYAILLDRAGRQRDADAARREALGLVEQLASTVGPDTRSGSAHSEGGIILAAQAQDLEPVVAGNPRPALGTAPTDWSRDLRARYFDETGGPWLGVPATDAPGTLRDAVRRESRLPERAVLLRRLAIRTASYWLWRQSHRFLEPTLPFFDNSVAAARRLPVEEGDGRPPALVNALTDRAMLLVIGGRYPEALSDYTEALKLLGTT